MRAAKTETEARQEQIAQAALDVIGEKGFHGLSIAAIAQRVGIVPSAVYRHFKGKDAVLDAVLGLLQKRLMENVAATLEETQPPLERLKSLLLRHARMLAETRAIPQVILSDGMYAEHPERKDRVRQIMEGYLGEVQKMIRKGQKDGVIRRDVEPATAARMFLGILLPAAVLEHMSNGAFDVLAHAVKAWPAFERSIATGASPVAQRKGNSDLLDKEDGK